MIRYWHTHLKWVVCPEWGCLTSGSASLTSPTVLWWCYKAFIVLNIRAKLLMSNWLQEEVGSLSPVTAAKGLGGRRSSRVRIIRIMNEINLWCILERTVWVKSALVRFHHCNDDRDITFMKDYLYCWRNPLTCHELVSHKQRVLSTTLFYSDNHSKNGNMSEFYMLFTWIQYTSVQVMEGHRRVP